MICLDASVAVKLVVDEDESDRALALLARIERSGDAWVVPALFFAEVTNVMHRKFRAGLLSVDEARSAVGRMLALPIGTVHDAALYDTALLLAVRFGLPAAYDAIYLALCQREGSELWTADRRLIRAVRGQLPWLRPIETFEG